MNKLWWIPISIVIVIVVAMALGLLASKIQEIVIETNGEMQSDIVNDLKDELNKYANGGLTQEEIDKQTSDDSTPRVEDQIIQMNVREYADGVLFYYTYRTTDGDVLYPNLYFRKVDNALCVDGLMNVTFTCNKQGFLGLGERDVTKGYFTYNFEKIPTYEIDTHMGSNNLASVTDKKIYCWTNYANDLGRKLKSPNEKQYRAFGQMLNEEIAKVYRDYFAQIGNLSVIDCPQEMPAVMEALNTMYTYLYKSCKTDNHEAQTKIVNISNVMVYYIPDNEKENYPIPEDKQAEYGDKQFYDLFVCDKFAECTYTYNNTNIKSSGLSDEYKEQMEYNELQPSPTEYASLTINMVNGNNANLGGINFIEQPVKITFNDNITTKVVTFDSSNEILYGKSTVLEMNKNYTYTINSDALMFENLSGSFTLNSVSNTLQLTYQYVPNSVVLTVGLNLVGSVDYSQLDLSAHPVVITLNNDNHSYTYTFDDNDSVSAYKSQIVALGTYNYTILSDQLVFTSTSGTIDVSTSNRLMVFNCGFVGVSQGFDISINSNTVSSGQVPVGEFTLYFDDSIFSDIVSSNYNVSVYIYNNEGIILDHDFVNKKLSSLISGQTTNTGHIATKDHFVIDNTYTVQVAVIDTVNNIYYYSTPEEFVFMGTCEITIDNFNIGDTL